MKRAQSSMEFVILVGFMSAVFISFFVVIQDGILSARQTQLHERMEELESVVINEILIAREFGDEYTRTFFVPEVLVGRNFTIEIVNQEDLVIKSKNSTRVYFFTDSIEGNLQKGTNTIINYRGKLFLNTDLEAAKQIRIDGDSVDWDLRILTNTSHIQGSRELEEDTWIVNPDGEDEEGTTSQNWGNIARVLIEENNTHLFIYAEVNSRYISPSSNIDSYNLILFLNTDNNKFTGYRNTLADTQRFFTDIGADYAILFDPVNLTTRKPVPHHLWYVGDDTLYPPISDPPDYQTPVLYKWKGSDPLEPNFDIHILNKTHPDFEIGRIDLGPTSIPGFGGSIKRLEIGFPKSYLATTEPVITVMVEGQFEDTALGPNKIGLDHVPGFQLENQGKGAPILLT